MPYLRLAARLTLLATLAGALLVGAAFLLAAAKPVSACLAAAAAVFVVLLLHRAAASGDRALALLVSQIASGLDDRPPASRPALVQLDEAIRRALDRFAEERRHNRQAAGETAALLDSIPIALLVLGDDGSILTTNRAARRLVGQFALLDQVSVLGDELARLLVHGPAGTKEVVSLADERTALCGVSVFAPAGSRARRLVSLQFVAGDLSAVELNAWQSMARVLAHEMMNSLTPVISLAESLEALCARNSSLDQAEVAKAAGLIARRAAHIMNFTDRYREMVELPEPVAAPARLSDLLEDVAALAGALPGEHSVSVRVHPPRLSLECDRALIEQALLNLVKNAAEAAGGESPHRISLAALLEGEQVCITVGDNGAGLPADHERIFLPFYSTKAGGSGIGLAIARQIASMHGGTLVAERREPGALFKLCLPKR